MSIITQLVPPPHPPPLSRRSVLSRFSWLSVGSMVAAAEASVSPVRLGVAKPLGASSVASEYQQASSYGYTPSYSRR